MAYNIKYTPSKTCSEFLASDAKNRVIMGPVGSGKSVVSCMELVRRATQQQPDERGIRKSRACVIRRTTKQLKDTTLKTWMEWFPEGICGTYNRTDKIYTFKVGDVEMEILFRALDQDNSVSDLLSMELTFAWINECREIKPDIINTLSTRLGRYPKMVRDDEGNLIYKPTWSGMWADTNPPRVNTWWYRTMLNIDHDDGVSYADNGWEFFRQPSGRSPLAENLDHLPGDYYDPRGRPDEFVRVYIDGEFGNDLAGCPVFSHFRPDIHIASETLAPIPRWPVVVGMDLGLTPAAVFGQLDPFGRVVILAEAAEFGMPMDRFINTVIKPIVFSYFPSNNIIIAADPSGVARSPLDGRSVIGVIRNAGFQVIPACTNLLEPRINAVDTYLMRHVEGGPALVIDPRCVRLKAALMGGYHYDPNKGEKPIKNEHSHIADALQYMMLHIGTSGGLFTNRKRKVKRVSAAAWT